jgi:hypothetical protein
MEAVAASKKDGALAALEVAEADAALGLSRQRALNESGSLAFAQHVPLLHSPAAGWSIDAFRLSGETLTWVFDFFRHALVESE